MEGQVSAFKDMHNQIDTKIPSISNIKLNNYSTHQSQGPGIHQIDLKVREIK